MIKVDERVPKQGQRVIAYLPEGQLYFAVYRKVITWKGRKYKFVNLMGTGSWHDDVIGWNRIPLSTETI